MCFLPEMLGHQFESEAIRPVVSDDACLPSGNLLNNKYKSGDANESHYCFLHGHIPREMSRIRFTNA